MAEKKITIDTLKEDQNNFNMHTEEGMRLLDNSFKKVGIIEAITVAEDGTIISGNARYKTISEIYGKDKEAIQLEIDGNTPVVLVRKDIQSNTVKFYEAAILANTTAKENINLDVDRIEEVAIGEFDVNAEDVGLEIVQIPDYNSKNKELTEEDFQDKVELKLKFDSETYLSIIERLKNVGCDSKEDAIIKLLDFYEQQS